MIMNRLDEILVVFRGSPMIESMSFTKILPCNIIIQQLMPPGRYLRRSRQSFGILNEGKNLEEMLKLVLAKTVPGLSTHPQRYLCWKNKKRVLAQAGSDIA